MTPPVLVRLPGSHRKLDRVRDCLGYEPHQFVSFHRAGHWARLPDADAIKLLAAGLASRSRVDEGELVAVWYQPDTYRGTPPKDETCKHARERLYDWTDGNGIACSRCCECGRIVINNKAL